jgi:preprotein translocase subunit SecG
MFGARRASDFLSKSTIVLAVIFLLGSLLLNILISKSSETTRSSIIQENSGNQPVQQRNVVPNQTQQPPVENQNKPGGDNQPVNPEGNK